MGVSLVRLLMVCSCVSIAYSGAAAADESPLSAMQCAGYFGARVHAAMANADLDQMHTAGADLNRALKLEAAGKNQSPSALQAESVQQIDLMLGQIDRDFDRIAELEGRYERGCWALVNEAAID